MLGRRNGRAGLFAGGAGELDGLDVLARLFGDGGVFARSQEREIDEVGTGAEGTRAGANEVFDRLERDAARRHEVDLREWGFESPDVARPAHRAAGEDLDRIGPGSPGAHDFRGRQSTRHDWNPLGSAALDRRFVQSRTDDERCTRANAAE